MVCMASNCFGCFLKTERVASIYVLGFDLITMYWSLMALVLLNICISGDDPLAQTIYKYEN